ncbi:hypothetical protein AB205_0120400 [Aquarana catesbeiana]|uniref:Secreted protein n=1 Tax=Aquarana catesbeiana TaxID=8400 RepID=A0A2G9S301_AQUCT|nr:hypothetical protein AB205_0120400 [Aquarana catesbeiana]
MFLFLLLIGSLLSPIALHFISHASQTCQIPAPQQSLVAGTAGVPTSRDVACAPRPPSISTRFRPCLSARQCVMSRVCFAPFSKVLNATPTP